MFTQMIPHAPSVLLALGLLTEPAPPLSARGCGAALATQAGLSRKDADEVLQQLEQHSVVRTGEFLRVLHALAYVESRFRADRRSERGAVGILQVTPVAAEHIRVIRRASGLRPGGPIAVSKLAHTPTNVNIGSAYLWLALQEADGDWVGALTMYNGGYKQLTNLRRGGIVAPETSQYVLQVLHLANTCGLE